jgi:hypothetical protein
MNFYRHHWYYVGGVLFVALAYFMGFWGNNVSRIQVILIYSFMAMLVHQVEEYAIPGGFPAISNIATFGETKVPDRYPLSANQCLNSNVFLTYPFYLAARHPVPSYTGRQPSRIIVRRPGYSGYSGTIHGGDMTCA